MAKFRKKPVEIEAIQWTGGNAPEVLVFVGTTGRMSPDGSLFIDTLEGTMRANVKDWVIKGVKGEFYACKPDIFTATYDTV